jgi:gliding motility-associated-like protein/uncharacterized repeat protein (TIGR01451 family)
MPADITVECDGVPAAPAVVTASDNCDSNVLVEFTEVRTDGSCPDTYTLIRTWTATDNCGNSITHIQTITVEDTTAPIWDQVMPVDITVECNVVPDPPAVVTATDNCDTDVTITFTEVRIDGACIDSYTLTRTWTATDNCGNETIHVQVITVEDTTAPTWDQVMPAEITVECDGVPEAPAVVTASDNCDSNVLVEFTETRTDGSCPDTYTLTRTWTATDNCGNSITHVQVISVEDTTAPVWDQVMPADITVECDGVPAAPAVVTASDNCDADVLVEFTEVRTDGSCPDTYTLIRTWTATDNCGNSITHVQVISVEDTTAPVWDQVMPADITVECDALPAAPAVVTASDNCDSNVLVEFTEARTDGVCPDNYTLTRTWTATDNCGNSITHVQLISVEDTTAPAWDQVMPTDITVECDGVPEAPAVVTASDNCDSNVLVEFTEARTDSSCPDTYTLTRTWTATDTCGNETIHVQVITVEDTTAPTWDQVMPADITVECDGVPEAPAVVTASDNCDSNVLVEFTETRTDGSCPDTYTLTRTWTATDNCGNETIHVQVITVEDTTAPTWDQAMPADISVECDEVPEPLAQVTASDNCDDNVTIQFSEVRTDGECEDSYTLTRTWTATDICGNQTIHVQVITVEDTTPPVFTVIPEDLTVECDGAGNISELEEWIENVAATDNCSDVTISNDFVTLSDDCGATGTVNVTWTAIDMCGNSSVTSASFTILDTTPPVIVCPETPIIVIIPAGETGYIVQDGEFDLISSDDICSDVSATHNLPHTSQTTLDGYEFPLGDTEVIWTAADDCGNVSECSFIVTVYAPSVTITKSAEPQTYSFEGQEITYTITVTNNGNATLTDVVVTDPLTGLNFTIETILPGETLTFTETYIITYNDLFEGSVENTAIVIGFDPEGNEITDNDTEIIYVVLEDLEIILVSQTNVLCFGDETGSAEIQIIGGLYPYTITWHTDPEQSGLIATNLPAGTYVVIVTDALGNTTNHTVVISQPDAPLNITYQVTHVLCNGVNTGSIDVEVFGGTEPYSFLWNTGATTESISDLTAGFYLLTIEDANGCILVLEVTIDEPDALFISDIEITGVLCKEDEEGSIHFNMNGGVAPYTYLWNNGASTQSLVNVPGGEYQVVVTDANGCELVFDFFIPYEEEDCEFRIPQGISPNGDGLNDFWVINGLIRFPQNVVRIYNRWGTLVFEAGPYQNNWDGRPNRGRMSTDMTGKLPSGTYFYVIELEPGKKAISGFIYLTK